MKFIHRPSFPAERIESSGAALPPSGEQMPSVQKLNMSGEEASVLLFGNGIPNRESIEKVWNWLAVNRNSPESDNVLNELMMAVPVEIAPELISTFELFQEYQQRAILHALAAMLDVTTHPVVGDDLAYMGGIHQQIATFLDSQARKGGAHSASAYDTLLGNPHAGRGIGAGRKEEIFERFLQLQPAFLRLMYPREETDSDPEEVWARNLVSYSLGMGPNQTSAISRVLDLLPSLQAGSRLTAGEMLVGRLETDEMLLRAKDAGNGPEAGDVVLTPPSLELLKSYKAGLTLEATSEF